ncbi:MAG: folate-binding protein [Alysiella sp.]|uniref:CAF17-like 4Fe-4S cluster assembly/insertion protein YgfZ n=1 Tax=Alysiella sp. TaxID=1872483 RepID=UPI0026DAF136|nr:folate-binding protein [Alysiella sp.]MDO4433906.1 folate-binding protein [Alysiella sp.]
MHTLLPFFAVVRVSGDDRHDFLHKQLSNDINNLTAQQACYATYNSPKGRVIANMVVYNNGQELDLILAADLAETVVKRLKMFVLRAHVQLSILPDWGVSGSLPENTAILYAENPTLSFPAHDDTIQLPHGGCLKIAPLTNLPSYNEVAEATFKRHEILCGYPWISAKTSETCVAQMLNQHTIGGVHFRKGCYPGQEIIARAQYRGQVKRGLAIAENTSTQQVGAEVHDESGAEVGIVINVSGSLNLLVIKHSAAYNTLSDLSGSPFTLHNPFFSLESE